MSKKTSEYCAKAEQTFFFIRNEVQIAFQWQREKRKSGLLSFMKVVAKSPFSSPLKGNLHSPSLSLWGT